MKALWRSSIAMLEYLTKSKNEIMTLEHKDPDITSLLPTLSEWEELQQLIKVLLPWKDAVEIFEGSSWITSSLVLPLVYSLLQTLGPAQQDQQYQQWETILQIVRQTELRHMNDRNESEIAGERALSEEEKNAVALLEKCELALLVRAAL